MQHPLRCWEPHALTLAGSTPSRAQARAARAAAEQEKTVAWRRVRELEAAVSGLYQDFGRAQGAQPPERKVAPRALG